MDDFANRSLDSVESELCALNIPIPDREQIMCEVRARVAGTTAAIIGMRCDPDRLILAKRLHRLRMRGNQIMGAEIMRDPKYEMLLALYIAHHEQRRDCVSTLCAATNSPQTTGLRHIEALERQGFLTRSDDWMDGRRSWVLPTARALAAIDRYLGEFRRSS